MHTEIKGDKLILTFDLNTKPVQSKSAIAKAISKGEDPAKVPATMIASTGGFVKVGNVKVSANVLTA